MNQTMVVTNIRLPQEDYRQIKAVASQLGMSINEYIHVTVKEGTKNRQIRPAKKLKSVYEAFRELAMVKTKGKPMGWSKEDEAIYSV